MCLLRIGLIRKIRRGDGETRRRGEKSLSPLLRVAVSPLLRVASSHGINTIFPNAPGCRTAS